MSYVFSARTKPILTFRKFCSCYGVCMYTERGNSKNKPKRMRSPIPRSCLCSYSQAQNLALMKLDQKVEEEHASFPVGDKQTRDSQRRTSPLWLVLAAGQRANQVHSGWRWRRQEQTCCPAVLRRRRSKNTTADFESANSNHTIRF